MRIHTVSAEILRYELEVPMADAQINIPDRICVLVRIRTDDGAEGIGEAAGFGGSHVTVKTIIEQQLAPLLLGEDPLLIGRQWDRMYRGTAPVGRRGAVVAAISGVDVALWDLMGKVAGRPVYQLLGGTRSRIRGYASAGFYMDGKGPDELAAEMEAYVGSGFTAAKMKIAALSVKEDVARVRAVRNAVGPDTRLMIDANNQYSAKQALRMAAEVEQFDITWFEEPVPVDDFEGARTVYAGTSIPIAGYETETTRWGFRDLIARGTVDIVQPDAIWSGGISEAFRIAALASAWNLPLAPHNFAGAVSAFANLHLLMAAPTGLIFEMDQNPNPLRTDIVRTPLDIGKDGFVDAPTMPGLGFELDEGVAARFRIDR